MGPTAVVRGSTLLVFTETMMVHKGMTLVIHNQCGCMDSHTVENIHPSHKSFFQSPFVDKGTLSSHVGLGSRRNPRVDHHPLVHIFATRYRVDTSTGKEVVSNLTSPLPLEVVGTGESVGELRLPSLSILGTPVWFSFDTIYPLDPGSNLTSPRHLKNSSTIVNL